MPNPCTLMVRAFVLAAAVLGAAGASAAGGGSMPSMGGSMPDGPRRSPEALAREAYNDGLERKERAWEYEREAATADSTRSRDKASRRAIEQYEKALARFERAIGHRQDMHEAWSEIGYVRRQLGDTRNSLAAYQNALKLKPDYLPAFEYRAETFLAMGELDATQKSYMALLGADAAMAAKLMDAMRAWVAARTTFSAAEQAFATWVEERAAAAAASQDLSAAGTRAW